MSKKNWQVLVNEKFELGGWIVQELLPIPSDVFPVLRNGEWKDEKKYINFNPYVIGGAFANAICRISDARIINIGMGGGLLPTYFIDNKEKQD